MKVQQSSGEDYEYDQSKFKRWIEMNEKKEMSTDNKYGFPRISSEYPDCSMPLSGDSFNYCSASCLYCFSYAMKSNNPAVTKSNSGMCLKGTDIKRVSEEMKGLRPDAPKWKGFYSKRKVLQVGSMADPFDNVFESKYNQMEEYIKLWNELEYPVRFCSKFYPSRRLLNLFEANKEKKNYAFMYSIITGDEVHARHIEYGADTVARRFEALKDFGEMGYYTMWRLRPFMMGTTDITLDKMLDMAIDAKVNSISTEWFCIDSRANENIKRMYTYLKKNVIGFDYVEYSKPLSPSCRGGYLRLNRDVKEPYVRKMYLWAKENGVHFAVSDPDFKELNDSGSCCGLPNKEDNKWHPDLSNYCRSQWTEMLVNARKNFWKKNTVEDVIKGDYEDEKLYFDQQIKHPDAEWMKGNELINETIEKTGLSTGATANTTYVLLARKTWNSVKSPKGPSNYFHGKIMPCGYDENDNIIYKYNVMPYEILWQKEYGIKLDR